MMHMHYARHNLENTHMSFAVIHDTSALHNILTPQNKPSNRRAEAIHRWSLHHLARGSCGVQFVHSLEARAPAERWAAWEAAGPPEGTPAAAGSLRTGLGGAEAGVRR